MEETNYVRKTPTLGEALNAKSKDSISASSSDEKTPKEILATETPKNDASQVFQKKSFWQKLALKDKSKPNLMLYRGILTMRFVTWPVVFYAG